MFLSGRTRAEASLHVQSDNAEYYSVSSLNHKLLAVVLIAKHSPHLEKYMPK